MKRLFIPLILLFCFCACGNEELDDLKKSIKEQEELNAKLKKEEEDAKKEEERIKEENERKKKEAEEQEKRQNQPSLYSLVFLAQDNPFQLIEDATCEILEGNIVECWVPNIMSNKILIPRFEIKGESMTIDGKEIKSGVTSFDFRKPVTLTINNKGQSTNYTVYVHSYTGLPVVWLETEDRKDVRELNWNYTASFKLVENAKTRAPGDIVEEQVKVKGVAPINWYVPEVYETDQIAKNGYIVTFSDFVSLLDESKNNDWELFPNNDDNTMIRQQTAMHLSRISSLDFTPAFHFVELMLNGRYYGTYMLGDLLENSSSRVDVGLDGYILKIDSETSSLHFKQKTIEQPISVLAPVTKSGESAYVYLRNLIDQVEDVLFSVAFTTSVGWQKFLDMDSFVDWYLINEITKNEKAAFQSDCYMHFKREEKIKMGPLWWNFDTAYGHGTSSGTEGFVVKTQWYNRLLEDPAFVKRVKERFTYFYTHKDDILAEMRADVEYLKYSVLENNNKWGVFPAYDKAAAPLYQKEVQAMEKWLNDRMEWLNKAINDL
jgi:hypothetical protein